MPSAHTLAVTEEVGPMTLHDLGRTAEPDQDQPVLRTPKEVLESPPRRWPKILVAVLALLVGIGLGNWFFGGSQRQLEDTVARLEAATAQLGAAQQEADRLRQEQTDPAALAEVKQERAAFENELDRSVVATARLFDAISSGVPVSGMPADEEMTRLVEKWVSANNDGDTVRHLATYTPDGVLTLVWAGSLKRVFVGTDLAKVFDYMGVTTLTLVGETVQRGDFLWVRYRETKSSGVLAFRVEDGKIAHAWFVVTDFHTGAR